MLGATQRRTAKDAHNRDEDFKMDSGQNNEIPNQKRKVQERCNGQANHHICNPETPFVVWPYDEERRHERCKASNNNEGGREETSRKARSEMDGQNAERSETTPARPRLRTEPRRMEEDNHGDRPRTGIRSTTVSNGEHNRANDVAAWPCVWQPTPKTADVTVTKILGYVRIHIIMNR